MRASRRTAPLLGTVVRIPDGEKASLLAKTTLEKRRRWNIPHGELEIDSPRSANSTASTTPVQGRRRRRSRLTPAPTAPVPSIAHKRVLTPARARSCTRERHTAPPGVPRSSREDPIRMPARLTGAGMTAFPSADVAGAEPIRIRTTEK